MIRSLGIAFLALVLPSCLLLPHTSRKFPAMHGRLLDAVSLQPVSGAQVSIHDQLNITAVSDQAGFFRFRAHRNFHLLYHPGICGWTDWPEGSNWTTVLDIRHPEYEPLRCEASENLVSYQDLDREWALCELFLQPRTGEVRARFP